MLLARSKEQCYYNNPHLGSNSYRPKSMMSRGLDKQPIDRHSSQGMTSRKQQTMTTLKLEAARRDEMNAIVLTLGTYQYDLSMCLGRGVSKLTPGVRLKCLLFLVRCCFQSKTSRIPPKTTISRPKHHVSTHACQKTTTYRQQAKGEVVLGFEPRFPVF